MNKIIFTICTLCMFCISCTESSKVKYTIQGTVSNMNVKKVYLRSAEGDGDVIDSTTISNNSFRFKGTQPKICFASLSAVTDNYMLWGPTVILENGIINVSLDYPKKVTGTPTNDILNSCNEKINAFDTKLSNLLKQKHELKADQKDERANLEKKLEKITDEQNSVIKECINQNLNNVVGVYLLNIHKSVLSIKEIDEILANIPSVMKENYYTKKVMEYQEGSKRAEIGQKFTDFKLKDPNDKEVSLSDYIGKGKYVLIDFWASWCGPCRKEMPNVKAVYEKFASKGFEIVGVSLDSKKEDWLEGIKDLGITWPQMSDLKGWQCEGAKLYGVHGIPSTLLVDPNGIIIAKDLRGEAIEKKLSELLN